MRNTHGDPQNFLDGDGGDFQDRARTWERRYRREHDAFRAFRGRTVGGMLVGLHVGVDGRVSRVIARQRGAERFCFRGRLAAATIVSFGSTFCRSGEEEEMETHGDKLLEQAKGGDQEALLALLKQHYSLCFLML